MIQRIQTVFLMLVAVIAVLLFVVPVEIYTSGAEVLEYSLLPVGLKEGTSPIIYGLCAANAGILIFSLVAVFQYKNRNKQLKTSRVPLILAVMQMGTLFVFSLYAKEGFIKTYTWASFLPIGVMLFSLLAGVFIKKDEELVRSADRLR